MAELVLEKLTVKPTRMVCDVRVEGSWRTTPRLIAAVLVRYPTLLHHACVNDEGETFAAVADHTSLPHLLEHLVIAMQVEAAEQHPWWPSITFVGTTEWTDRAQGVARVEVKYVDDLVAIQAFSDAVALINRLLVS